MTLPFRYLLRVRYGECDAQGIVYNARWGDYIDIAVSEYGRTLFGAIDALDWKLVKQTIEWRASARFDDVLDIRVRTVLLGTTSFVLACDFVRHGSDALLATAETTYVMVDAAGAKRAIPDAARAALERGAPGAMVDHAAVVTR